MNPPPITVGQLIEWLAHFKASTPVSVCLDGDEVLQLGDPVLGMTDQNGPMLDFTGHGSTQEVA